MTNLFSNIPQDPGTVAAVRRECDARGFAARCRERVCGRAGRCRARWRADKHGPDMVMPPCLLAGRIDAEFRAIDAQLALIDLRLVVAKARGLEDPDYAAEFDTLDPPQPFVDGAGATARPRRP